jgi:beta-galactosidase
MSTSTSHWTRGPGRRSKIIIAIAALLAIYAGAAPAQTVEPTDVRLTQSLMENWRFVQDDHLSEEDALAGRGKGWERVSLPHTWNAKDAARLRAEGYKRGVGWYRLEFDTPAHGARHWLEFGAASLAAEVWLNGKHLGQHIGGFTAFRFGVTDDLFPGGTNKLLVKVDNSEPEDNNDLTAIPPMRGDFNVSGGLYRHAALISTPESVNFALDDLGGPGVYATTTAIAEGRATVKVRAKLSNAANPAGRNASSGDYLVRFSLLDTDGQPAATVQESVTLAPGGDAEVTETLTVNNPRLWQGTADPHLYRLVAELLRRDGTPIDRVAQHFGIREMRFDPRQGFLLNGRQIRLHGVGMHQDLLGKAWAITAADIDNSLAMIKEMGANAVRYAHYPYSQYAYQRADELGLVIWAEAALGIYTTVERCSKRDPTDQFVASAKQQLREMIRQNYNHASIAMWAVGNESTQGQLNCEEPYDNVTPLLREMHVTAKSEDLSRPTVYAEYPHPVERSGPFATEGITDLFGTNRYFLWYTPEFDQFGSLLDTLHAKTPDQPLAVSEYGGGAALTHHTDNPLGGYPEVRSAPEGQVSYQPEEYAAYLHEQNYRVISSKPYLWGSFVWIMFDFGSDHRDEGDVLGVNTKGLVTFDHKTYKDPFYFYKANWSSEPVTHILGRRYTDRAYPVTDVKVYSNADSVQLSVNGEPVGAMSAAQCEQRTCVFKGVRLALGENTVVAVGDHHGSSVSDTVRWSLKTRDVNIAAGRLATALVATNGVRFGSDDFFSGGRYGPTVREASATEVFAKEGDSRERGGKNDALLYKYYRHGEFSYTIPLAGGSYEVTLGFIEPDSGNKPGDRVFNVRANGEKVLEDFDIVKEAGENRTPLKRTFPVDVSAGSLVLTFTPSKGEAIVSNIRIRAGE